jgi:hypothetical protein
MSELTSFLTLGFHHVASPEALDHVLFLLALAAIYRWRDWRSALWVVTAFTVGHSITLGLVAMDLLHLPTAVVEFLIPLTIVATVADNLVAYRRGAARSGGKHYRTLFAGIFGLVHGAGFAAYLQGMFADRVIVPLVGFNIGIELGQILVLVIAFGALALVDVGLSSVRKRPSLRLRVVSVSAAIGVFAVRWAIERAPW